MFFARRHTSRNRPQLLLWLLPLLFWSVASDGLHNHGSHQGEARFVAATRLAQSAGDAAAPRSARAEGTTLEAAALCSACQWLSHSSTAVNAPRLAVVSGLTTRRASVAYRAPSHAARRLSGNRGPPLS